MEKQETKLQINDVPDFVGIDMGGSAVRSVQTPTNDDEDHAANVEFVKKYVDEKLGKKIAKTFTINSEVYNDFEKLCDKESINKSKYIENSMKSFIRKNEKINTKKYVYSLKLDEKHYIIEAHNFYSKDEFIYFYNRDDIIVARFKETESSYIMRIRKDNLNRYLDKLSHEKG